MEQQYGDWVKAYKNPSMECIMNGTNCGPLADVGSGVTTQQISAAGSGQLVSTPSGVPSRDTCTAAKCGAVSLSPLQSKACSDAYGAQALALCVDPMCAPYRAGKCPTVAVPMATVTPAVQQNPYSIQVLTPNTLTAPLPDISAHPYVAPAPSNDAWCSLNTWIAGNPLIAFGIVAGAFFLAVRKGR